MSTDSDERDPALDPFDYELPRAQIARRPAASREAARLLVLPEGGKPPVDRTIADLPAWLRPGDLLVRNATRVLPARLVGHKASGGACEALILQPSEGDDRYRALVRTSGRLRVGLELSFARDGESVDARVAELGERGEVVLAFAEGDSPYSVGRPPLPPYILKAREGDGEPLESRFDDERYQTVFARVPGSVAAPTAGLHLSDALLSELEAKGVEHCEVVLHVGAGTFRPVRSEDLARGELHAEPYELTPHAAGRINTARSEGRRVVAVGTTTVRVLESCVDAAGQVVAGRGETRLFLKPGSPFGVVDALLTNFHLPRSSLLLLVCAFAGRERVMDAYAHAVASGYRFYSYGDAMLIL